MTENSIKLHNDSKVISFHRAWILGFDAVTV